MKYMSYASGQYVMSIDEAEDSDKGIRYLVRELKNEFCDRNYHLNLEGCS